MSSREEHPRAPATYRIQLSPGFGFAEAARIASYLSRLGITHAYLSPVLEAAPGSTHGYDVVDHSRASEALGGEEGFRAMCEAFRREGLEVMLDIVPNHMAAAGRANRQWWDVLENGLASRYARWFDVDWRSPEPKLRGKLLLPVLGEHYGEALYGGRFRVRREGAGFTVEWGPGQEAPLSPESVGGMARAAAKEAGSEMLEFVGESLEGLPAGEERETIEHRERERRALFHLLDGLFKEGEIAAAVDAEAGRINADAERMDALLNRQNYRLAYWRVSASELNYRRFFDINDLVAVRPEVEEVFEQTHSKVLEWMREGRAQALRVDHVDGLRDPTRYLERLRRAAGDAWIVVEKITAPGEGLPEKWPVEGTTGYEFLNAAAGLFVDRRAEKALTEFAEEMTGEKTPYYEMVKQKKHLMMDESFGGEMDRLADILVRVSQRHAVSRDYSRSEIEKAMREMLACIPVHRTYVRPAEGDMREGDAEILRAALQRAAEARPEIDGRLWKFLEDLFFMRLTGELENDFVLRFQQYCSPITVKAGEDTAYYQYNRLNALNEIGGEPTRFGRTVRELHELAREAQEGRARGLLATATHDTKHGEDSRLRMLMISEVAEEWMEAVRRWFRHNERHRKNGFPEANAEYLFYQTLVGAWPIEGERLDRFLTKAGREAKVHTNWMKPDEEYEGAVREFARGALGDREFVEDFEGFLAPVAKAARIASLSQALIKYTFPGVPDLYWGSELWDLDLVDPDNRRPVDFALRERMLAECERLSVEEAMARMEEGTAKLFLTHRVLGVRRQRPEALAPEAEYAPMEAAGEKAEHLVAYARGGEAVTIAPRLVMGLDGQWGDTFVEMPRGRWKNVFTSEGAEGRVMLGEALGRFPAALFVRERG